MDTRSMSTRAGLLALVLVCMMVTAGVVLAGSYTATGTIGPEDTALANCTPPNYAEITPFSVASDGTYTLDNPSPPGTFNGPTFFYAAVFTTIPSDPGPSVSRLFIINNGGTSSASGSLTAGPTYYLVVGGSAGCGSVYPVSYSVNLSGPGDIVFATPEVPVEPSDEDVPYVFADGRINRRDLAAPVAVYPASSDSGYGLVIYDAYNPNTIQLQVSAEQMTATAGVSENTLIASDDVGRVSVYRLADGTLQVNASMANGKLYVLSFPAVFPGVPSISTELE